MNQLTHVIPLTFVLLASVAFADILLQGVGDDHARSFKHDRFHAGPDRAFIAEGLDFSGVGQGNGWVTMISPTHFLSANHAHPRPGSKITFWEADSNTDPAKSHTYIVDDWGHRMTYDGQPNTNGSDLWLGRLTAPLDPAHHITYYPVLQLPADADYIGRKIYVVGRPFRVGISRITAVVDDFEIGETREMRYDYHAKPGEGFGESDCYLQGGDSGGPSFTLVNGKLALLGIHFTNNTSNGLPDPQDPNPAWSGDSFVPFYLPQLNAHITGQPLRIVSANDQIPMTNDPINTKVQ
ncbi:MAG: trypsin-like serine peptidase [Phycisphaerales bacterium]